MEAGARAQTKEIESSQICGGLQLCTQLSLQCMFGGPNGTMVIRSARATHRYVICRICIDLCLGHFSHPGLYFESLFLGFVACVVWPSSAYSCTAPYVSFAALDCTH